MLVVTMTSLLVAACGGPCDDLAEVCDRCDDPANEITCDAVVAVENDDVCSDQADVFEGVCP